MTKIVSMVAPVPAKPKPAKKADLAAALEQLGNDRPYTLIEDKPDYWLVHFLGDPKATRVMK
jgi:hypothetical protein